MYELLLSKNVLGLRTKSALVAEKKGKHIRCRDTLNGVKPFGENRGSLALSRQYHPILRVSLGWLSPTDVNVKFRYMVFYFKLNI